MMKRIAVPTTPAPLVEYAKQFDDQFGKSNQPLGQTPSFRSMLHGTGTASARISYYFLRQPLLGSLTSCHAL